jgi:acetyl esterase/lipase
VARNATDILTDPPPPPADERVAYGAEPLQFADLRNVDGDTLAVVLHGGSWKATYNLIHLAHLCILLGEHGVPTLNVEYRRVGDPGGGWRGSLDDVLLAIDFARTLSRKVVLVGHSAGGHLGLLAAKRTQLPVVALAAVCDPATWDNPAVAAFFAGREPPPEASPFAQAPLGVPTILIHGTADDVVPYEQSERYAGAAGDEAALRTLDGARHFEAIDPASDEVVVTLDAVRELLS